MFLSAVLADEYLVSYEIFSKDAMLSYEKLLVSKSMTKCSGKLLKNSIYLPYEENQRLSSIIKKNFDQFFDYIKQIGLDVKYKSKTKNYVNTSYVRVVLHTTCFKVDFNDSFVKITAIK